MKKALSLILALVMALGVTTVAFAGGDGGFYVNVAIADSKGVLQIAYGTVWVADIDEDGAYTINDALYCAHNSYYEGGAAAGYESAKAEGYDGLSLKKLWGETNGGSFGYYVNDNSAWSLLDPVKEEDYVYAFCYQDTNYWTDTYSYFDKKTVESEEATEVELTLSMLAWNADFSAQVIAPVKGAEITIDGEKTGVKTDENGKATVSLDSSCVVSAVSPEGSIITPPVCNVDIPEELSFFAKIINAITSFFNSIIDFFRGLFA